MTTQLSPNASNAYQRTRRPMRIRLKVWLRAIVDISLLLSWTVATFTGVILWPDIGLTPEPPNKGEKVMLWSLTTGEWGTIHTYASLAAVAITLLHIWLDWKALKGAIKYLIHSRGVPA